MSMVAIKIE